jgi:hypothetical protein
MNWLTMAPVPVHCGVFKRFPPQNYHRFCFFFSPAFTAMSYSDGFAWTPALVNLSCVEVRSHIHLSMLTVGLQQPAMGNNSHGRGGSLRRGPHRDRDCRLKPSL